MAPKKLAVTSKALQALLTRIGSASSGTKSLLLARFQRDVQKSGLCYRQPECKKTQSSVQSQKLRIVSIDMGIKNLAFCNAEVSHDFDDNQGFDAHMKVLRWKKLNLVGSTGSESTGSTGDDINATDTAEEEGDRFSPSVLSRTAYNLIVEEVLSVRPDIVLIEKQRWRSGGGSAVQQWTVRVNTLEAMLWAILETLKQSNRFRKDQTSTPHEHEYHVHAVDPKRVGQYWLGQHARALQEKHESTPTLDAIALSTGAEDNGEEELGKTAKTQGRSKAEKSAKIAILRSWLATDAMSSAPSTPSSMPLISFSIDSAADSTRQALLPRMKATRQRKTSKSRTKDKELIDDIPAAEIKKLDDVTDCFLQAAAWVAWEANRLQLKAVSGDGKATSSRPVDEERILEMIKKCGEV